MAILPMMQVQVAWSDDGTAVFAFRGTSKQQDAWQDLKLLRRGIPFLEEMYPGVKAHVGALLGPPARARTGLSSNLSPHRQQLNADPAS